MLKNKKREEDAVKTLMQIAEKQDEVPDQSELCCLSRWGLGVREPSLGGGSSPGEMKIGFAYAQQLPTDAAAAASTDATNRRGD